MKKIILIAIISFFFASLNAQNYNDSPFKVKLAPLSFFDNSGGNALAVQLEYSLNSRFSVCLENFEYLNRRSDRFLNIDGRRTSISIRRYRYQADMQNAYDKQKGIGAYMELEFAYKDQKYSTVGNIYNERIDTTYQRTLDFQKSVAIANFKFGTVNYITKDIYAEIAFGLGLRYRKMSISQLDNYDDNIGNIPSEQFTTYWWADHRREGFLPSITANLRFTFLIPRIKN